MEASTAFIIGGKSWLGGLPIALASQKMRHLRQSPFAEMVLGIPSTRGLFYDRRSSYKARFPRLNFSAEYKTVPYNVKFQIPSPNNGDCAVTVDGPTKAFGSIASLENRQLDAVQVIWNKDLAGENVAKQAVNLLAALGLSQRG